MYGHLIVVHSACQDRGEGPHDPLYEKVLKGLNLVARHAAMPLLDALLAWRKDAESQASRAAVESVVLRKKVMCSSVHMVCDLLSSSCVLNDLSLCLTTYACL